ncbi:MAG TPA: hypothetical protein VD993_07230 [Chitinophagaceae bacterium]|nr:hypothetical protein [Chitinophagaceae bacterium]
MGRSLSIPIVALVLFSSCHEERNAKQAVAVGQSLKNSNYVVATSNEIIYSEILDIRSTPAGMEMLTFILPQVKATRNEAAKLVKYVDSLIYILKEHADDRNADPNNTSLVRQVFETNRNAEKLYERLRSFKDTVRNNLPLRGPRLNAITHAIFPGNEHGNDTIANANAWASAHFHGVTVAEAGTLLEKFKNDVLITEREALEFHRSRTVIGCGLYAESFAAIAAINSTYVQSGEVMEIVAGLGVFERSMSPKITIDGVKVSVGDEGIARYKLKARQKPGMYAIPVLFEYLDTDGSPRLILREIRYVVAK